MRALIRSCIVLALAGGAAGFAGPRPAQAPADDVARVVDAAAAYLKAYQEELTSVVADETYTQHIRAQIPKDKGMVPVRNLRSEIFFMFAPGEWMAIRDIMAIDGKPLGDRPDLKMALQLIPTPDVARKFKAYNSRFNIGRIVRTFNEPTFSLLPLDAAHRARFTFAQRRSQGPLVTIAFEERGGPTLVRNMRNQNVFSSGEYTIEPATGRIRRAMLAVTIDTVKMTFTTTYEEDQRLEMLVPVRFGEHYQEGVEPGPAPSTAAHRRRDVVPIVPPTYEEIVCEAKYTNFRRFEVKARIR